MGVAGLCSAPRQGGGEESSKRCHTPNPPLRSFVAEDIYIYIVYIYIYICVCVYEWVAVINQLSFLSILLVDSLADNLIS